MDNNYIFQKLLKGEEKQISNLVNSVFKEFVAPDFSDAGIKTFLDYILPDSIIQRSSAGNHFIITSKKGKKIIGVIEIKDYEHICLLFVDKNFQEQGIAKRLYEMAVESCRKMKPDLQEFTVNSSKYAIPVYEKLGFRQIEGEQMKDGIIFIPMKADL